MNAYLDTSALIAWFHPADTLAPAVHRWRVTSSPEIFLNPLLRHELRHNLRRISDDRWRTTAWNAYRAAEAARLFVWAKWDWSRVLDDADTLSVRYGGSCAAGSWDWAHVAAAHFAQAELFVTGDEAQASAARIAGIRSKLLRA